jgi:N-acetylmuramoyl-L-alanine amidase
MERPFRRCGFVLLVLLVAVFIPAERGTAAEQKRYTVLIDPAHGGDDLGVVSDRMREKDLTLKLALLIRREGGKIPNLRIELTRSTDLKMTTAERIKAAGKLKPDCLVSLHINAGFGKKAAGYEVYFPGFRPVASGGGDSAAILNDMVKNKYLNDAVRLAQKLQAGLDPVFPRKGRGLRDAPNALLDGLAIPGVVVELGFASHPEDRKALLDEKIQTAMARALVKGLQDYFQK